MQYVSEAWREYQRHRFMRQDGQRFRRPDPAKYVSGSKLFYDVFYGRKYSPDQPRVPRGDTGGGQWTSGGGGAAGLRPINDLRVISDEQPDELTPGAQLASGRFGRGPTFVRIGGRTIEVGPAQAARLLEAETRAETATARVRELDRSWKPPANLYELVEGLIQSHYATAQAAQARINELGRGPGPFAVEFFFARGPERNFTVREIELNNSNGRKYGCHTCGTFEPGTKLGNFVLDHQNPTALSRPGVSQRIFPQCLSCSQTQGGWVRHLKGDH